METPHMHVQIHKNRDIWSVYVELKDGNQVFSNQYISADVRGVARWMELARVKSLARGAPRTKLWPVGVVVMALQAAAQCGDVAVRPSG